MMNYRSWALCLSLLLCVAHHVGMTLVEASECLIGCELLGMYAFDDDRLVEWEERSTCDDSAECEVLTPDSEDAWRGCGETDGDQCLWATVSDAEDSSDCACSVCGANRPSDADDYMDGHPIWTRIACFLADMELIGYDVSICVAAVVDDGAMACVDEDYQPPTLAQLSCLSTQLEDKSAEVECLQSGDVREAEEMFVDAGTSSALTPAPAPQDSGSADDDEDSTPAPDLTVSGDPTPSTTLAPMLDTDISCATGIICPGDMCCHPDSSTCGRSE